MLRRALLIAIVTALMATVVFIAKWLLGLVVGPPETKWIAILYVIVCAPLGAIAYAAITLKIGLAQKVLGERITRLTNKLGL